MDRVRAFLKFAGKGDRKVVAVFGVSPQHCDRAVRYLRRQLPDFPVWLFSTTAPAPETAALCEGVLVERDSLALLVAAQKQLWPRWVALALATWTGEHGRWPVKLAPLLVPPFRALIMNEPGDFFAPRPGAVLDHAGRRLRDQALSAWNRARDVSAGLRFGCFALVAQRFSFMSRWAFARWHGAEPLEIAPVATVGEGVAVFRHRHRQWNLAELRRLLGTSTARWILFLEPGACERWEDLAAPFADPLAFAVTRQIGYRAWKPCLVPVAPFRTLQPGEYSRTLAPVSNALLVDRAKLARLGLPRTVVPGSAWLMLFWQAAAAGWHCYSAGGDAPLIELPDWPYEEAEFASRVLMDRQFRRLGPCAPHLERGSIATTAPSPVPGPPSPLTVLVVSPYLPYPLSHGGAVRIYNLCRALAGRVDFILACFREKDDTTDYGKLREVFREVYVVDRDERPVREQRLPHQVREHASRSMSALIGELCRSRRVDLLQIEYTHMAHFRDAAPQVPAILVEHDLTFTLYRQYAERDHTRAARLEAERWLAFETAQLRRFDAVWTMSEDDRRAAIEHGSAGERSFTVANGVDLERFTPGDKPTGFPEVLYVGSFRHRPNVVGFEMLRHEIMPRVWQRFPEARLRVVAGPEPARYWSRFLSQDYPAFDRRILMHAFVADLRPLYACAAVVAVPLLVSAGTNIKVMEAMACGKAVVTTPVGCGGLELAEGRDAIVRGEPAKFADAICELLERSDLRAGVGAAARRTVEQRFGWPAMAEAAWRSYQCVARGR